MLEIKDLHASVNGKEILKGINLSIKKGEVHAIMGPNGSGKSTLSSVLVGNPAFEVTKGSVTFEGKDLLALSPEDRAGGAHLHTPQVHAWVGETGDPPPLLYNDHQLIGISL